MRLTIIGGGGFRVPLVYSAVAAARERVGITEIVLTDSDADRLAAMAQVLTDLADDPAGGAAALPVSTTTDLDAAITGASVIFAAVRVGGTAGRIIDERVALDHGLLGQETIGPGGLAYAIRTLSVMEHIARRAAELAPQAWIINFTNPAGLITEAMRTHNERVVGICDTPIGLVRRVGRVLDLDLSRAHVGYIGLNHLGWLRHLTVDGVDHLPRLLADARLLGQIEEARVLGVDWVQTLGALPNEYLFYYYFTRAAVASIRSADATRGEFLNAQQGGFYEEVAHHPHRAAKTWRATLYEREATYMAEAREGAREEADTTGGYHEVAVDLMAALLAGETNRMILNVPNHGAIPTLPADAVIEVPCEVSASGIRPLDPPADLDLDELGIVTAVKAADRALIAAVRAGSRSQAWRAFGVHPLVDSVDVARDLLEAYIQAQPLIAAALPNE